MTEGIGQTEPGEYAWPAGKELHRSLQERIAALADEQVVVERCASCPDFVAEGPFAVVRESFRAHVADRHPELLPALARRRMTRAVVPRVKEPDFVLLRNLDRLASVAGAAA